MIDTVFFDFDGVIVESVDIKTNAFAKLFEGEGEPVVKRVVAYHLNNTGVSRYDKFRHIYKEMLARPLDEAEFGRLCDRFAALVVDEVVKAPYVKGAEEFLTRYAPVLRCYVVSAAPQSEIEEIIDRRGIAKHFRGIYGAPTKKGVAVKEVLLRESARPSAAAYIGDAISDYHAAKNNRVHFIARISNNEAIFDSIDCVRIDDLMNLKSVLDRL